MTDPIITAPINIALAAVILAESVTRDPVAALGGGIGTALVVAAGWVIREWLRNRRHARNNRAQEAATNAELLAADTREAPGLIDRIERLLGQIESLQHRSATAEAEAAHLRKQLADIAEASAEAAHRASGREDTQVRDLRRLASESRAEMPAYRDPDQVATSPETPSAIARLPRARREVVEHPRHKDPRRE